MINFLELSKNGFQTLSFLFLPSHHNSTLLGWSASSPETSQDSHKSPCDNIDRTPTNSKTISKATHHLFKELFSWIDTNQ